jgi:hypothetical protein
MVDDRQRKEAVGIMRLVHGLGQCFLAPAQCMQGQRELGVDRHRLRGEFQRLPIRRLRLREAIRSEERAPEKHVGRRA